ESISPFLTTDEGLNATTMVELGLSMRSLRSSDMYFLSVPHGGPYTTSGGASVVAGDEEAMDVLREALRTDEMGTYYAQHAGTYCSRGPHRSTRRLEETVANPLVSIAAPVAGIVAGIVGNKAAAAGWGAVFGEDAPTVKSQKAAKKDAAKRRKQ